MRVPLPHFAGEESDSDVIVEFADGRKFYDVTKTFNPETVDAIVKGMICLRCLEPQSAPDADEHLPGCEGVATHGEHYMRDRQRLDFMAEFVGDKHMGPSRPIQAFLEDQMERQSKRKFIQRVLEGGQGKIPKEWLEDEALFPNGVPDVLKNAS